MTRRSQVLGTDICGLQAVYVSLNSFDGTIHNFDFFCIEMLLTSIKRKIKQVDITIICYDQAVYWVVSIGEFERDSMQIIFRFHGQMWPC